MENLRPDPSVIRLFPGWANSPVWIPGGPVDLEDSLLTRELIEDLLAWKPVITTAPRRTHTVETPEVIPEPRDGNTSLTERTWPSGWLRKWEIPSRLLLNQDLKSIMWPGAAILPPTPPRRAFSPRSLRKRRLRRNDFEPRDRCTPTHPFRVRPSARLFRAPGLRSLTSPEELALWRAGGNRLTGEGSHRRR